MNLKTKITAFALLGCVYMHAQDSLGVWTLNGCINYALTNNIQIQKSKISLEQEQVSTKQAKAQLYPSLSASIGQNFSNNAFVGNSSTYSGNYGINASMDLYNGGKKWKAIQQQKLYEEAGTNSVASSELEIKMSILQLYMQILYAAEAVSINQTTVETAQYQRDRGEALMQAGSISKVDFAQLESQLSSDKYQLIVAENQLRTLKLDLKQLLELTANEQIDIDIPAIDETLVLNPLEDLNTIYADALNSLPNLKNSKLENEIAEIETAMAKSGYIPRISLTASVGTNHNTQSALSFSDQLLNNFNEGIGVSVSIPIFSNRETKSAVEKAQLAQKTSELGITETEKDILNEVENAYYDAIAAQTQYIAAKENLKALETSYGMIQQQFELGIKNTLELLTEKNNYLSAQQNLLQTKYTSIINTQMLNLYRGLEIAL